jgi:hypothetical protein
MNNMRPHDIDCYVGVIDQDEDVDEPTAFMYVDFGIRMPSFRARFEGYKAINLDAVPMTDGGYSYNITSDAVEASTTENLSFFFIVSSEEHREFTEGCAESGGIWSFVFVSVDAIECVIDKNGVIISTEYYARNQA